MTDVAKAIAFATHCLKWADVKTSRNRHGTLNYHGDSYVGFHLDSAADLKPLIEQFLGERYFIQINRGKTGLFHWQVMVGVQDLTAKDVPWDHAQAEGEDLWDCVFDACV